MRLKFFSMLIRFVVITYSAVLSTMPKNVQCCCPQHGKKKIIGAVGFNANDFSTLLPTMRKSALISVNARFSALLPITVIIFYIVDHSAEKDWCCCLHSGKIIGVVDNNAEKCLNSNISMNSEPYANLH